MGNEPSANDSTSTLGSHHQKTSTGIKPAVYNYNTTNHWEYSTSKSKTKTKSRKSKSKSKSIATFGLPDISTQLQHNGSSTYSTTYSSIFSPKRPKPKKRRNFTSMDLKNIKNGITGTHISARIVKIAAQFWEEQISHKSLEDKLEFGCAIYFGMLVHNAEMKKIFTKNLSSKQNIETSSVKFLDMLGWLIRSLLRSDVDLLGMLENLGQMHKKMGIKFRHFDPMLQSMHETFSYYFPIKYGIQIKYAIDQIFTLAARVMTGQLQDRNENIYNHLNDLQDSINKHEFLQSLDVCLSSNVGREYLYRYLQQTFCDEIAIFLQSLTKFKVATSDKERFMIARSIVKNSIEPAAAFAINISYDTRSKSMNDMIELERIFFEKDDLVVSKNMFQTVEKEIHRLIMDNHWRRFNQTFKNIDTSPTSPM